MIKFQCSVCNKNETDWIPVYTVDMGPGIFPDDWVISYTEHEVILYCNICVKEIESTGGLRSLEKFGIRSILKMKPDLKIVKE